MTVSDTENFRVVSTSSTASTLSVIATGLLTADGVDHPGKTADTLVFPLGSFKVTHKGATKATLNPKTCLLTAGPPPSRCPVAPAPASPAQADTQAT